jgi:glycosyltransferase involved in cell wall biosynthesis
VLILSGMFPDNKRPILGIWVREQALALSKLIALKVVVPTPFFPPLPFFTQWYAYREIPREEVINGVSIYRPRVMVLPNILSIFSSFSYFFSLWLFFKIRSLDFDLIHAHRIIPEGVSAILLGKVFKKRVIITVHGSDLRNEWNKVIAGAFVRWAAVNSDRVISPHPELTAILRRFSCKLTEIPNCVNFNRFVQSNYDANILSEEFKIKNKKIVLFVGNLVPFKDPITLIEAVPYVVSRRSDVVFIFLGAGPLMHRLRKLAKSLNIENYVIFAGIRKDVPSFLGIASLFVSLSPVENLWSVALIEAMSAGVPCIVANSGYTARLSKKLSGILYLIEPKNPKKLGLAILDVLSNKALAKRLAMSAKIYAHSNFDATQIAKKIVTIYMEVIDGKV